MTPGTAETGRELRARTQRGRILAAAKRCFIEHGFHAASIANIAEVAGMSPSLMYRYFENKNAIVLAIIEEQLDRVRADIASLGSDARLAERMLRRLEQWREGDPGIMSPALVLEMSAEATRDPVIASAIGDSDRRTRKELAEWFSRPSVAGGLGLDLAAAASRALLVQCLAEGLAVRAAREPAMPPGEMEGAVRLFYSSLFGCGGTEEKARAKASRSGRSPPLRELGDTAADALKG